MVHMPITTLNRAYTKTIQLLINLYTFQKLYYIDKSTNFYFRNLEKMLVRRTVGSVTKSTVYMQVYTSYSATVIQRY